MPEDIQKKVVDLIVDQLGVDADSVTPDSHFIDDLGADSLDTVELVMAFEEEFDIEIPDEDAEKLETVSDAIGYLKEKEREADVPEGSWGVDEPSQVHEHLVRFLIVLFPLARRAGGLAGSPRQGQAGQRPLAAPSCGRDSRAFLEVRGRPDGARCKRRRQGVGAPAVHVQGTKGEAQEALA